MFNRIISWIRRGAPPGKKVLETSDRGYRFRVYLVPDREGFEIVADEAGAVRGRKFVPWSFEPRYGIDAQDLAEIEHATEELLEEMMP
jgi:hypothetical protein